MFDWWRCLPACRADDVRAASQLASFQRVRPACAYWLAYWAWTRSAARNARGGARGKLMVEEIRVPGVRSACTQDPEGTIFAACAGLIQGPFGARAGLFIARR